MSEILGKHINHVDLHRPLPSRSWRKTLAAGLLAVASTLAIGLNSAPADAQSKEPAKTALSATATQKLSNPASVAAKLATGERARVIVMMQLPGAMRASEAATASEMQQVKSAVRQVQDQVLASLPVTQNAGANEQNVVRMSGVPAFAASLTQAEIEALAANPAVVAIDEDLIVKRNLDDVIPLIGANTTYTYGGTGQGTVVAIIDDGAQITHPFLSGKASDGGCFLQSNSGSYACPNGQRYQTGSAAAGVNANSGQDHGTHVAGIAVGKRTSGTSGPVNGVAKDANFMPLNVFGSSTGASSSDIIKALEYARDRKDAGTNIVAVNLSLGFGQYSSTCDTLISAATTVINQLVARNVATTIATGNDGYRTSVGWPACISSAISVGNTTKSDQVSTTSNSAAVVDVLAPGTSIISSVAVNGFASFTGTSMAAPAVAGAWAAIRSCAPTATVSQIEQALESTGTQIADQRSGGVYTKPRIRVNLAAQQLGCSISGGSITVSPSTNLSSSGPVGGSFSPSQQVYTVTSTAQFGVINWSAADNQSWISMSPTSGSLNPGASVNVTVSINSGANALGVGNYTGSLAFVSGSTQIFRSVSLSVTPPATGNDSFAGASLLTGTSGSTVANNASATGESGEPNHAGASTPLNSIWWKYVAPATGKLNLSTNGSDFDTTIAAYVGSSVSSLTGVASNDDHNPPERWSFTRVPVTQGQTYHIAVDGFSSNTGNIQLNYSQPPAALSVTPGRRMTARRVGQRIRYRVYNRGGKDIVVRLASTSWLTHRPTIMRVPAYTARYVYVTVNNRARRFRGGRNYIGRLILRPVGQRAITRTILYRAPTVRRRGS